MNGAEVRDSLHQHPKKIYLYIYVYIYICIRCVAVLLENFGLKVNAPPFRFLPLPEGYQQH